MPLTSDQYLRYARHLTLPEFGEAGQEKLLKSSVLLIGAGGLGSPLAMYLAAAGIGRLGIMDFDVVDTSNLQRQIIHRTQDVGTSKAKSARRGVNDINLDIAANYIRGIWRGQCSHRAGNPMAMRAAVGINEEQYVCTGRSNACVSRKPRPRLQLFKKAHFGKTLPYLVKWAA